VSKDGEAHTQTVESFFAIIKRGVTGSFHSISEQHLQRYVARQLGMTMRLARSLSSIPRAERLFQRKANSSTTFRFIGKNDRVCISAFDDPKVPGVACHVSQARTGGLSGTIGLAEDPSRFSIACRQVGPITVDVSALTDQEEVYSARTSIFFKRTHVYRVLDKKRNTLVYLAISDKLIDGSPQNAISTVPIMPWGTGR
jgi:CreA protein